MEAEGNDLHYEWWYVDADAPFSFDEDSPSIIIKTEDKRWNDFNFARALPDEALEAKNIVDDGSIPDVPMTNAYAEGIYKLYRAGILRGSDEEHNCNPSDNIKHSEVAAILTRMMTVEVKITFEITVTVTTTEAAITTKPAVRATALKIEKQLEGGGAYISASVRIMAL